MPRRTQVAKTQPKRKRSTQVRLTAEKLLARKVPKGVVTAAEAIKDPNSGLSKAVARLGQQITDNFEAAMEPLRAQGRFMQQFAALVARTQRDLAEIASDCLEPDGNLNRTLFEAKARVRLDLRDDELWAMPMHKIVALFRAQASYDDEKAQKYGQKTAEELMRCIVVRSYAENVPAVLDHQSETLGEMVYRHRAEKKWSRGRLARLVGVEESTIKRWEGGKHKPTPKNIRGICEAFKIPVETLENS